MPSALVVAEAAVGGPSLTVAAVDNEAVAVVDAPPSSGVHWPADLLLMLGLTMDYRLQQIRDASPNDVFGKLGGIEAVAAGLKSFLRLLDEDMKTQAEAAISMPATKVIIAPH